MINNLPSFRVQRKRCDQCLFTQNRIVSKERMEEVLKDCRKHDTHFQCHKSHGSWPIMCRGFYDTQPKPATLQIAEAFERAGLGRVEFVE